MSLDLDQWSETWTVPRDQSENTIALLRRQLFATFNDSRTFAKTGRIVVQPHHLYRPGQAGLYLLERMGTDLTPLPDSLKRLVVNTSCQHRIEWFGLPGPIPGLLYYDGRLMYAGCCQNLGIAGGQYRHTEGEEVTPEERGRARVYFRPAADWPHVGLLAVQAEGAESGWFWPREYHWYATWADLAEIRFARQQGWEVEVREKLTWPEARPLDLWADRLSRLYQRAKGARNDPLAGCYRSILLHTIGRLHNIGYHDERSVVSRDDPRATLEAVERIDGEEAHIRERAPFGKRPEHSHPEWSAAIWAKVHLRLNRLLLNVTRETLLAIRGDALYVTGEVPVADEGKVGQFRIKGRVEGPLAAPRSFSELRSLTNG